MNTRIAAIFPAFLVAGSARAVSLGEMAQTAATDLETVPLFISIIFYLVGAAIFGFGLLKLKRHFDQPQASAIGGGIITLVVGALLIAAPALITGMVATLGLDGSANLVRPKL